MHVNSFSGLFSSKAGPGGLTLLPHPHVLSHVRKLITKLVKQISKLNSSYYSFN